MGKVVIENIFTGYTMQWYPLYKGRQIDRLDQRGIEVEVRQALQKGLEAAKEYYLESLLELNLSLLSWRLFLAKVCKDIYKRKDEDSRWLLALIKKNGKVDKLRSLFST